MKIGFLYGLVAASAIFGLLFIKKNWVLRILITLLIAGFNFGLLWLVLNNNLMPETGWGNYGYWDLTVTYYLIGLVLWESYYQIGNVLKNKLNDPPTTE